MSGRNLRMSDTETLKFVQYYRNEPTLWDPTNDNYKERETRAAAAKRIAKALNLPDFTASHVITKFKNLRSSYAQELKKIAASKKNAFSTEDIYVPKVIWFREMDAFLRPHVKSGSAQYNSSRVLDESIETNSDNDEVKDPQSDYEFQEVDIVADPSPQPEASTEQPRNSSVKRPFITKKLVARKRQNAEKESPEMLMSAMTKLDKISDMIKDEKRDQLDHFGKYIASILRTLPNKQALKLQQDMITTALNAQMSILT